MKILLLGKNGQVGWELNRSLQPVGEVIALDRTSADFSDPEKLRKIIRDISPDVIVNAVAYTAVDKAEEEEDLAQLVNGVSPGVLAEEAARLSALLLHFSTDYVFDGSKEMPYLETDEVNPINIYGKTKLAGEKSIESSGCDYLIFRTSWVYASRGSNFLLTILRLANERDELSIVSDQIGTPTSARLIAEVSQICLRQVISERKAAAFASGIYHLTAKGSASWFEFAEKIIDKSSHKASGFRVKNLNGIPSSGYPTPAERPMNSRLDVVKLEKKFGLCMPHWEKSLGLCVEELS